MKRILIVLLTLLSLGASAQFNLKIDTMKMRRGGSLWKLYDYTDSLRVNSHVYNLGGANYWTRESLYGKNGLKPTVKTDLLKIPGMGPYPTSMPAGSTLKQVFWFSADSILWLFPGSGGGGIDVVQDTIVI